MHIIKQTLVMSSIALATALSIPTASAAGKADLVPQANALGSGKVGVKNIGKAESRTTWLTIQCLAAAGCPEHPGMNSYKNPKFSNAVTIKVPALKAGASFNHQLSFWNKLQFKPGQYKFLVRADAGNDMPESNELNNKAYYLKKVNKPIDSFTLKSKAENKRPAIKVKTKPIQHQKINLQNLKTTGKRISFKQLPIDAQRAVERSFNIQVKGTSAASCSGAPKVIDSFANEVSTAGCLNA